MAVLPLWREVEKADDRDKLEAASVPEPDGNKGEAMFYLRALILALFGMGFGIVSALMMPLLLLPDALETSVLALPVPIWAIGVSIVLAAAASLPAFFGAKGDDKSLTRPL